MNFLKPDKNIKILHGYHLSSKILIPSLLYSGICHYKNLEIVPIVDSFCVMNIGFHSYVSVSCVIHDYIKPTVWNQVARVANLKTHVLAISGYLYALNVYKKYN